MHTPHKFLKLMRPWKNWNKALLRRYTKALKYLPEIPEGPIRFRPSLPDEEDLKFTDELSLNLILPGSNPGIYVLHTTTNFSAAIFWDLQGASYGQAASSTWLVLVVMRCATYSCFANLLRAHQESAFTLQRWKQLTTLNGIELSFSGVQTNCSFGTCKWLHDRFCRIYREIRNGYPDVGQRLVLKFP